MNIKYPDIWEVRESENGLREDDILLCITSDYSQDAVVSIEQLLELRAEIDKFLFLEMRK